MEFEADFYDDRSVQKPHQHYKEVQFYEDALTRPFPTIIYNLETHESAS